jgi:hypothetical protein
MGNQMSETAEITAQYEHNHPALVLQPDNHDKKYEALFHEIDTGQIKLPMFQRSFVWDKEQSSKLLDSILRGYPVGTFIFWKTKEDLRSYKELGNHKLPQAPKGDYVQYILDGQQRITSLYAIRKGIRISKDGMELDYKDIFVDLDFSPASDEHIVVTERRNEKNYVSVHDILSKPLGSFYKALPHDKAELIEFYKGRLINYDFSTITIKDYPIDIACEVFSRINTGGKILTAFEIMVAKTYDEHAKFDLAEKYEVLRDGSDDEKECLTAAKFETIAESIVMQCVAAILLGAVRTKDILKIRREDFIANWDPMKASLFTAVDFIRTQLRVPVSQLVPYPAILVPFAYFFHKISNKKPTHAQSRLLEQFFYWVGLTGRYSSGSEGKIADDFKKMELIAKGESPLYQSSELKVDPSIIEERTFSAGNAYCKTILCLLAFQQPKSFDTNGIVILDNSHLKIATSRNYHHFFPKAYLGEIAPEADPNLLANITLIDGYSNKHGIGKKAPSKYVAKFAKANPKISESLATHLIFDLDDFGVLSNDYETFISKRATTIADALNEKLNVVD